MARHLTGVLLVGGASTRFGSPKALARIDGRTLAEIGWETLGRACDERIAVGKAADALPFPFPLVDDSTSVRAPIAGVIAGLRAATHDVTVFLPVDCPAMTPEALRLLGEACTGAAVPQTGPLPGAYAKSALPVLERRLARGELGLRAALPELDAQTVELEPAVLHDVDFPADL